MFEVRDAVNDSRSPAVVDASGQASDGAEVTDGTETTPGTVVVLIHSGSLVPTEVYAGDVSGYALTVRVVIQSSDPLLGREVLKMLTLLWAVPRAAPNGLTQQEVSTLRDHGGASVTGYSPADSDAEDRRTQADGFFDYISFNVECEGYPYAPTPSNGG